MWQRLLRVHGGRYRVLFILIHAFLSASSIYLSPSLLVLKPSSIFQMYFSHRSVILLSNSLYLIPAYTNPGYILPKPAQKKTQNSTVKISSPRSENEDRLEALESGNSEFPEDRSKIILEFSSPQKVAENQKSRKDQNKARYTECKSLPSTTLSPRIKENIERISLPKSKSEESKNEEFGNRFCLVCNVDQPVRARHCGSCKKCVYKWDHHCTWLGNCIGERNYFGYVFYLLFQSIEIVNGIYYLIIDVYSSLHESVSILLVIILVPVGTFSVFLTLFHFYLIGRNRTTSECISWNKVFYLAGKNKSPFDLGFIKNVWLFCSIPRVKDWNKYLVNL